MSDLEKRARELAESIQGAVRITERYRGGEYLGIDINPPSDHTVAVAAEALRAVERETWRRAIAHTERALTEAANAETTAWHDREEAIHGVLVVLKQELESRNG